MHSHEFLVKALSKAIAEPELVADIAEACRWGAAGLQQAGVRLPTTAQLSSQGPDACRIFLSNT